MNEISGMNLAWLKSHEADGILNHKDVIDMKKATARVFNLLIDLEWHSAESIRIAAGRDGVPASEGLRRLRDLRKPLNEYGLKIQKAKLHDSRLFYYRLWTND